MKPIRLHFEGLFAKSGTYEFNHYAGGLAILTDVDITLLYGAVRFALFGEDAGDDAMKTEWTFSVGENVYRVERSVVRRGGVEERTATVYDAENNALCTGNDETTEFLYGLTKINVGLFEKIFLLPKGQIAAALSTPESGNELLGKVLNRDITAEGLNAEYEQLKEGETALLEQMEAVGAVDKKEIEERQRQTKSWLEKKEKAELDYEIASSERIKLAAYEQAEAELMHYREQKERLEGKRDTVEEAAGRLTEKQAAELREAYEKELDNRLHPEKKRQEQDRLREERAAAVADTEEKQRALEDLASAYVAQQTEENARQERISDVLRKAGQEQDVAEIHRVVDELYEGFSVKIRETEGELQEITARIKEKEVRLDDLTQKKQSLHLSAEYRNAVSEGSVLETRLQILDRRAKRLNEELAANERAEKTLAGNERALEEKEREFNEKQKLIEDKVRGNYPTFKDAVNADAYYKQTLYSKHLAVSMQEVELRAVLEKIEAVKKVNEGYRSKMDRLELRKQEVAAHRKKLTDRLDAVEEKLRDLMTRNRLRDLSDEAEYGSRCPICDGFVTVKKELPVRDTSALQDQVAQLKSEIEKDSAALNEAMNSIGQYQAAEKVSAQYLASLNETKEAKEKLIRDVLTEYHSNDTPELFAKVRLAVDKSNAMTALIDKYHISAAEISRIKGVRSGMKEELSRLRLAMAKGKEELEATVTEMQQSLDRYEKLQSFFNGENAAELLEKMFIVTSEYERTEIEAEKTLADLTALKQRKSELSVQLISLQGRTMPLVRKGKESDYLQVVAQASADVHRAMLEKLDGEALREGNKISADALGKALSAFISSAKDAIAKSDVPAEIAAEDTAAVLRAVLEGIGAPVTDETDELVLAEYVLELYYGNESAAELKQMPTHFIAVMEEKQAFFDKKGDILQRLDRAAKAMDTARKEYEEAKAKEEESSCRAENMLKLNRVLTDLQERLTYAEESRELSDGDTLSTEKLRTRILREASGKVQGLSGDRYDLDFNEQGVLCIRNLATEEYVDDGKASGEERTLKTLALSLTYADTLLKISGGRFLPVLNWGEEETDEASVRVLCRYADEMSVAVCPERETAFYELVGRLGE